MGTPKPSDVLDYAALVEEAAKKVPKDLLSEKELQEIKEGVVRAYTKGTYPLSELGFSREAVDLMYQAGTRLYEAEKYEEADDIFSALSTIDPTNFRASFGVALCRHKIGRYGDAILFYLVCLQAHPDDPLSFYYMADCFVKLDLQEYAIACLSEAYLLTVGTEKHREIGERALLWYLDLMKQKTGKIQNEEE